MLKNLMWQMFEKTGDIEYFLNYKGLKEKRPDFMTEAGMDITLDGEKWLTSKPEEWSSGK